MIWFLERLPAFTSALLFAVLFGLVIAGIAFVLGEDPLHPSIGFLLSIVAAMEYDRLRERDKISGWAREVRLILKRDR